MGDVYNFDSYSVRMNEILVKQTMLDFYDIQAEYFRGVGDGKFGNLQELFDAGLIDETMASGYKYGYRFDMEGRVS